MNNPSIHKMPSDSDYQILIVGAGIAGLHCAMRLSEGCTKKIAVTEAYDYVGGRCFTFRKGSLQWESGAGRIHASHKMITHYVSILSHLPPSTLGRYTVEELLNKVYGEAETKTLLHHFPYRSEMNTMRADLALNSLKGEMGAEGGFYIVKEGLDTLMKHMRATLEYRGVKFLFNHRLSSIEKHTTPIVCKFAKTTLLADKVILALHSDALKQINPFQNLPALKYLKMQSLLRTYSVYPTPAWFGAFPKMVTDSPLRFIIPIRADKGIIMSSYTDAENTEPWAKILNTEGESSLEREIRKETRALFPDLDIPRPIFFKAHLWKHGCTYWTPGLYDPRQLGENIMRPLPYCWQNVYVCGESYSERQAWMEGALEHSEKLLRKFF
jgi:monoamine oxidase